jgi:hypothetical protein
MNPRNESCWGKSDAEPSIAHSRSDGTGVSISICAVMGRGGELSAQMTLERASPVTNAVQSFRETCFKRVCKRSRSSLERLFDYEDFEVVTMLYDRYTSAFSKLSLDSADTVELLYRTE